MFDEESAIPHHFATFYCMSPGDFLQVHEALGVPDIMHTLCNKKFTGQTGLLVLLARYGTTGSNDDLGRMLQMNPKRLSAITNTMVHWLHRKWGHKILDGLMIERIPLYVEAIQQSSGIQNLQIFGFIDCTVRGDC